MFSARFPFFSSLLLLITIHINGQELTFGDASVVVEIKKKTSAIYANSDQTLFFLTNQKIIPLSNNGVNIAAHQANDKVNRVITTHMTTDGQASVEWYFDQGKLVFVYEVFEFFDESVNKGSWKNFKGLYGRESRYYFSQQKLAYHKHTGRSDIDSNFNGLNLLKTAKNILTYLSRQ